MSEFIYDWTPNKQHQKEEIVRCRDCRYASYDSRWCYRQTNADALFIRPDGFCAWGERRDA